MSTPLVTNIAPAHRSISVVGDSYRFSARSPDSEIDRSKIQMYIGSGPVFYRGGILPEDQIDKPKMYFQALSGHPNAPATREITVDDFLRISKLSASQNQEAVYFMGGLEAPASPTDPLMAEFTLRMDAGDVTPDGDDFSGVLFGLLTGDSGLTVKFFTAAGTQHVEIHSAELTATTALSGGYVAAFDWDAAAGLNGDGSNTFKVLWHPQQDLVKLYVRDPSADTDRLLITGAVSDFPTVPAPERRANQPWIFFGHGNYPTPTSVSDWQDVFLFNTVTVPIEDGIVRGNHVSSMVTNNQTYFDGRTKARDALSAWQVLPDSFGTIQGTELVTEQGLEIAKMDDTGSLGFYRIEPKVTLPTILDFKARGAVTDAVGILGATGMEVYIDDGTKCATFSFLQAEDGSQFIGLQVAGDPTLMSSYSAVSHGFTSEESYRLVFIPGEGVRLYTLEVVDQGVEEVLVAAVSYTSLPDTHKPGPGVGFLVNAASAGLVKSALTIRQIRYSTNVEMIDFDDLLSATPPWTQTGTGTVTPGTDSATQVNSGFGASVVEALGVVQVSGLENMESDAVGDYLEVVTGDNPGFYRITEVLSEDVVKIVSPSASGADSGNPTIQWRQVKEAAFCRISDDDADENVTFKKEYLGSLQSDNGWTLEVRNRVHQYTHVAGTSEYGGGEDIIRASTGVMVQVLDGTYRLCMVFAEAGPSRNKVVFLLIEAEESQNLLDIRSNKQAAVQACTSVDWSEFHLYRLERTVGGQVRLFIDDNLLPSINIPEREFTYPAHLGGGNPRVMIGHAEPGILSVSDWVTAKFTVSDGYDVSAKPVLDEQGAASRYNNGINVIAEAEDL